MSVFSPFGYARSLTQYALCERVNHFDGDFRWHNWHMEYFIELIVFLETIQHYFHFAHAIRVKVMFESICSIFFFAIILLISFLRNPKNNSTCERGNPFQIVCDDRIILFFLPEMCGESVWLEIIKKKKTEKNAFKSWKGQSI